MRELFLDVFDNYFATRIRLQGKATIIGTPDQNALLSEIPKKVEAHLVKRGLAHLFKIKGSIGNGNIARVPWVGIFRKSVTENAENGYYIVLLFAENMSRCWLSLNQGITAVENLYTKRFAWRKMQEAAAVAVRYLDHHPEAYLGPIDLSSTGDLGRAYEVAAIESFLYSREALPAESLFFHHLDLLLSHYDALARAHGPDLYSLFTVSEGEFQQVALEKAAAQAGAMRGYSAEGAPGLVSTKLGTKGNIRSPIVAADAIRAAQFACEIDSDHWTFKSKAKKQRYVEAHHLIPICQQHRFEVSLDVVANVVSLCATCHRMLHYGVPEEKKSLLMSLLKQRKQRLLEKSINVKDSDFLRFYAGDVLLED
jgi:5-methylcytosine-specific restriction protein A